MTTTTAPSVRLPERRLLIGGEWVDAVTGTLPASVATKVAAFYTYRLSPNITLTAMAAALQPLEPRSWPKPPSPTPTLAARPWPLHAKGGPRSSPRHGTMWAVETPVAQPRWRRRHDADT